MKKNSGVEGFNVAIDTNILKLPQCLVWPTDLHTEMNKRARYLNANWTICGGPSL